MALLRRFEDIEAWQEARKLAQHVYALTRGETFRRDYELISQIRGACLSVMNNIAEGFDSGSSTSFIQFLGYAKRSASEVQSCLYLALDQEYISQTEFRQAYDQVSSTRALITGFIRYLRRVPNSASVAKTLAGTEAPRHRGT